MSITYDTSTGLRALTGSNLVSDIDTGFLSLATDVAAAIAAAVAAATPAGTLQATARSSAPTGFLLCDGAAVSRSTYSALFSAIGTTYGTGNGSTTFNVPDLRGRVPVGVDGSAGRLSASDALGNSAGEEVHVLTDDEASPFTILALGGLTTNSVGTGGIAHVPAATSAVSLPSNLGHNNLQPYQVVNWVVKT